MDANRPVRPKSAQGALCQMGQRDARDADHRKSRRANQIAPRVIGQMRDKEAHFGRIGGFCPKRFGTSRTKRREGRERAGRPVD
ncbi:hypothetical protein KI387_043825 [Taxus chinensis]|uniref:Uncharacterized protein n=1 Tax=Taxus chinensis TaxID=29808 RepID=A0AA38FQ31_TAXCH|nr:hypothetical protein KI387_043825 [Taxus chinensis]